MKYFNCLCLLLLILFSSTCTEKSRTQSELAHLRIANMIPNANVSASLQPKRGKSRRGFSRSQSKISNEYKSYRPGYYLLMVRARGDIIHKRTYVLGKNAFYTLTVSGLVPENRQMVSDTYKYSVKHIFAGSEARVKNNFLPISFMLYDSFHGNSKEALIRITNTAPNAPKISVKSDSKTIVEKLSYPKTSQLIYSKPGAKILHIYYGDIELAAKKVQTKAGYLYNIFVSNGMKNGNKLKVTILKKPTTAVKKKE